MSGERDALIVATGEYENPEFARLPGPTEDAEALNKVLGDPEIGDFAVQVVRDEDAHVIRERVEDFFSDNHPDDVLLLHFSCHGVKADSGQLYFAARNTRPNRLQSTAVPAAFVQDCMRASRARSIVLLLDCCYGGAFSPGVKIRATRAINVFDSFPDATAARRGHVVITAATATQYAFEGEHLSGDGIPQPSVFTQAVVDALNTGDADIDGDGWISLSELYKYVYDKVRERNPNQTPSRLGETQGELVVARARRRKLTATGISGHLLGGRLAAWLYDLSPDGISHPLAPVEPGRPNVVPLEATLHVSVKEGRRKPADRWLPVPAAEGMAPEPVTVRYDWTTGRWVIRNEADVNTLRVQPYGLSAVPLPPGTSMPMPTEDVAVWIPVMRPLSEGPAYAFRLLMLKADAPVRRRVGSERLITVPRRYLSGAAREAILMYFGEYLSWPPLPAPHVRQQREVEAIAAANGLLDRRGPYLARNRSDVLTGRDGLFRDGWYPRLGGASRSASNRLPQFHWLVEVRTITFQRVSRWITESELQPYVLIDRGLVMSASLSLTSPTLSLTSPTPDSPGPGSWYIHRNGALP